MVRNKSSMQSLRGNGNVNESVSSLPMRPAVIEEISAGSMPVSTMDYNGPAVDSLWDMAQSPTCAARSQAPNATFSDKARKMMDEFDPTHDIQAGDAAVKEMLEKELQRRIDMTKTVEGERAVLRQSIAESENARRALVEAEQTQRDILHQKLRQTEAEIRIKQLEKQLQAERDEKKSVEHGSGLADDFKRRYPSIWPEATESKRDTLREMTESSGATSANASSAAPAPGYLHMASWIPNTPRISFSADQIRLERTNGVRDRVAEYAAAVKGGRVLGPLINRIDDVYNDDTGTWGPNERENIENIAGPAAKSLFEKFSETVQDPSVPIRRSLITKALTREEHTLKSPEAYTKPFCDFLTENPTVFHAVDYFEKKLEKAGYKKLSERKTWNEELVAGGKYFVSRNGSSLIAFSVGGGYKSGNGVAMVAGHVDALTARLKPMSTKKTSAGYVQLGVAPYAGALNTTWWDRDLGIAGRVLVKDAKTGKITTKLVKLGWPIARIPTLAPHFGVGMLGQNNAETQAVPIIGLDNSDIGAADEEFKNFTLGGGAGSFAATQPPKLVRAIAGELSIQDYSSIVNWELELFDVQPAQTGGLDKEFIFAGRIDDKLCSWAALEGLLSSSSVPTSSEDGIIKLVGLFDDEEIGSLLRQGARGNFLPSVIERISESFSTIGASANVLSQTYANSFLVSADVTHAVNPNFLGSYLEGHAPRLNVGLVVSGDSNGHMTTDSVSTALLTRVAEKSDSRLQLFQIRNDSRSGGTVGPMLSSAMGVRAVDAGIPQLSMHSIRATTGSLDPGLGVKIFKGFFDHFESIDGEFE